MHQNNTILFNKFPNNIQKFIVKVFALAMSLNISFKT